MQRLIVWLGGKLPNSYRTKLGGAGLIFLGLIGAINMVFPDAIPGIPTMTLDECIAAFSGGFIAIGLGNKIDKNTEAVKASGG